MKKREHTESYRIMRFNGLMFVVTGVALAVVGGWGLRAAEWWITAGLFLLIGTALYRGAKPLEARQRRTKVKGRSPQVRRCYAIAFTLVALSGVQVSLLWGREWGLNIAVTGVLILFLWDWDRVLWRVFRRRRKARDDGPR